MFLHGGFFEKKFFRKLQPERVKQGGDDRMVPQSRPFLESYLSKIIKEPLWWKRMLVKTGRLGSGRPIFKTIKLNSMKAIVTIVFFEVMGKKRYVSDLTVRTDNSILPIYNTDKDEAHHFFNEEAAATAIGKFHNVHNREFKTEPYQVRLSTKNPFSARSTGVKGALVDLK